MTMVLVLAVGAALIVFFPIFVVLWGFVFAGRRWEIQNKNLLVAGCGLCLLAYYFITRPALPVMNLIVGALGTGAAWVAFRLDDRVQNSFKSALAGAAAAGVLMAGWMLVVGIYAQTRPAARARRLAEAGDHAGAFLLYREAAEKGDRLAQFRLGELYARGQGVAKDNRASEKWARRSAEAGHADAQAVMGSHSDQTLNRPAEAFIWYKKAADQGHLAGKYFLAGLYERGRGVSKDPAAALALYQEAAAKGHIKSSTALGRFHYSGLGGIPRDPAEAARLFTKAAEAGDSEGQTWLAFLYRKGAGVPKEDARAAEWYRKAASQGNIAAQYNLAFLLETGQGVPKDEMEAGMFYLLAAAGGNKAAEGSLRRLQLRMSPAQSQEIQQRAQAYHQTMKVPSQPSP